MTSLRLGLLAGLVLPLGLATAGFAQPAAHPAPASHAAAAVHAPHHHRDSAERHARIADHLRTVLQLTPAQEPALQTLLTALRAPPDDGMWRQDEEPGQGVTVPAWLDRMQTHMDTMRARFAAHAAAVKAFYAQLTPPQQKAFDDLAPLMMMSLMHGIRDTPAGMGDAMHHHHDGGVHDHAMGPGGPSKG